MNRLQNLWHKLTAPRATDGDEARQEYMIKAVLVMMLAALSVCALFIVFGWISGVFDSEPVVIMLLLILPLMGSWWLARRGRRPLAGYAPPAVLLLLAIRGSYSSGLVTTALLFYVIAMLLTAMLQGLKAQWFVLGLSIGAHLGLGWVHGGRNFELLAETGITVSGSLVGIALLQWFSTSQLQRTLTQARAYAAELKAEIGERRRTEKEIRRLKEFNENIIQNMAEGIAVQDAEGYFTFVNPAAATMLGHTREELLGRHGYSIIPPDQHPIVQAADERRRRGEADHYELELLHKDGRRLSVLVSSSPHFDTEEGRFSGTLAVFANITDQVQTKQEIQQAKNKLEKQNARLAALYRARQMINSTLEVDAILDHLTDEAMRVTRATHGQVLVVRLEEGVFERRSLRGFSPEEAEQARTIPLPLDQGVNGSAYTTRQAVCVDDVQDESGYFPLIPNTRTEMAVPITRERQVLGNLDLQSPEVGAFRDVDLDYLNALADQVAVALYNAQLYEQAQTRAWELAILNDLGQALTARLDVRGVVNEIFCGASRLLDTSNFYIALYNGDRDEVTYVLRCIEGQVERPYHTRPGSQGKILEHMMTTGQPLLIRERVAERLTEMGIKEIPLCKGRVSASWLSVPIMVGPRLVGMMAVMNYTTPGAFDEHDRDLLAALASQAAIAIENAHLFEQAQQEIVERRRAQAALRTYADKLERSSRELEEFVYVASHDLQEPLRKVQTFGDRLQAKYEAVLDEQGHDYLARMQSAAQRMRILINALLAYSRVITRAQSFVPLDLSQVVREVVSDLKAHIEQVGGRVDVGDLPTVDADPSQMRQLLFNLIDNALRFHRPEEPPVVRVYVESPTSQGQRLAEGSSGDGVCHIAVEDNGIGFDEKYLARIFQVFQRLHGRDVYGGQAWVWRSAARSPSVTVATSQQKAHRGKERDSSSPCLSHNPREKQLHEG